MLVTVVTIPVASSYKLQHTANCDIHEVIIYTYKLYINTN